MAVYPDVAAAAVVPVTFNPAGVGAGWGGVGARDPDVVGAVPAVIAGLPDIAGVRGYGDDLDRARRRWADADDDLRRGRCCCESEA